MKIDRAARFIIDTVGALGLPLVVVGPPQLHVVIDDNGVSLFGFNHGGDDVALGIFAGHVGMPGREFRAS